MYKNILIPIDGSEFSLRAAEHGIALAKFHGAAVTGITVIASLNEHASVGGYTLADGQTDFRALSEKQAETVLTPLAELARKAGIEPDLHFFRNVTPNEGILMAVKNHGCDLIVMATHARTGISAMLLGNETQKVIAHSTVPVLVVR